MLLMLIVAVAMQETSHRDAIHLLIMADRRSLNAELSDARTELESVRCELHAAKEQYATELQQWEQQTQTLQLQAKEHGTAITTTATTHAHTHTHTHRCGRFVLIQCEIVSE